MDQPFGFEAAKENYLAMHSGVPSKVSLPPSRCLLLRHKPKKEFLTTTFAPQASSQTTRQAFGNISNSGCFVVSYWPSKGSQGALALPYSL